MVDSKKPVLFVSCGQYTHEEKQLGKQACALIEEVRRDVRAYFAEVQSSPEALSTNILANLKDCAGFVCIMHKRGVIETPDGRRIVRGSVWIEQEIAIIAFICACHGKRIPTLFYCEEEVSVEGIRQVLHLNPTRFRTSDDVLADLRRRLPSQQLVTHPEYDVEPLVQRRDISIRSDRHQYQLMVDLENTGRQRVTDFQILVHFPKLFLLPENHAVEERQHSTISHKCFKADTTRAPQGLYPGQRLREPLTINYFVDEALDSDCRAMASEFTIEVFSGNMTPKKRNYRIKDYIVY